MGKPGSRSASKKELHKKGSSSKPNNEERRAEALNKSKAEPHTPPPVSDPSARRALAVDAKPNAKALKAKTGVEAP